MQLCEVRGCKRQASGVSHSSVCLHSSEASSRGNLSLLGSQRKMISDSRSQVSLFYMVTVSPPSYFMEMLPSSLYTGRVLITPRLRAALVPFTSASSKVQLMVRCWQG